MITGEVRRKGGLEMSQAGCERRMGRTAGGGIKMGEQGQRGVCVCVYV